MFNLAMHNQYFSEFRPGERPETTCCLPHMQLDQNSDPGIQKLLADWCFSALPGVHEEPSRISVPGARALVLNDGIEANQNAFMVNREFAHIHPQPLGGSLHLNLPRDDATNVIESGWGESHYLVEAGKVDFGCILVYAPRDSNDLIIVKEIIQRSYHYSKGELL